ncbi:MAG: helix-turn-helix domain-containing protein [Spirosomataceae bacterium]
MKTTLFISVFWWIPLLVAAQIHMEIVQHPPFKTPNERLFLASDFNNWQPGDVKYEFKRTNTNVYSLVLTDSLTRFKFKITQGSWALVEGDAKGNSREDRIYDKTLEHNPHLVQLTIKGWEARATYRFVITKIPNNTPKDATIYITGNFNGWDPGDENYQLSRQVDDTYRVTIVTDVERLEYKFSRGDWSSIEGQENGKVRPNRLLYKNKTPNNDNIPIEIQSWEDLSGTFRAISMYDLLLLFSVFQSILLIVAITTMQDYNRQANRWLVVSLAFIALMVLIKVVGAYREMAESYTKLLLVPDFVLFLYAPLFYFYIQKLLFKSPKLPTQWWGHFVLPAIQLLIYLPYFFMDFKSLQLKLVNREMDLMLLFWGTGTVALFVNVYYWFACRRVILTYRNLYTTQASYEQNLQYLLTVLALQAVCLVFWLFSGVLFGVGYFFDADTTFIVQKSIDTLWLAFSTIPYFLGYFAIHQPEIFKLPTQPLAFLSPKDSPSVVIQDTSLSLIEKEPEAFENLLSYKEKIDGFMKKNKPYTNAGLTLNELATRLKMPPYLLSKVINEIYEKNFFDFINEYRIDEFKQRFEDPRNRHYTMLAIAFEVGFNSKTAFNRSFKKMTQQTPREYFYESRGE